MLARHQQLPKRGRLFWSNLLDGSLELGQRAAEFLKKAIKKDAFGED